MVDRLELVRHPWALKSLIRTLQATISKPSFQLEDMVIGNIPPPGV